MAMYDQGYPYEIDGKAGAAIYLCQCGKSTNPPYCSGAHAGTGIEPLAHTPEKDGKLYVCGCGKTANKPFCDGSHTK